MGFEQVSGPQQFKTAKSIEIGEHLNCYITGIVFGEKYQKWDLLCVEPGSRKEFTLNTSGTLKYFAKDISDKKPEATSCVGFLCRITRLDDYKNKRSQIVSSFRVERDKDMPWFPVEATENQKHDSNIPF